MSSDVPSASAAAEAPPSVRSPGRGASEARSALAAAKLSSPLYYADYLMLPQLLASQRPLTPSSHELLFITTHQTMELWFKQVLFELAAVRDIFDAVPTPERAVGRACAHLERTNEIFALLVRQFRVLETMSALEFLEFRDRLYPASGFQSSQFRLLENCLGLPPAARLQYGARGYCAFLHGDDAAAVAAAEAAPSLQELVGAWLERLPALDAFDWWPRYAAAVGRMHDADEAGIVAGGAAAALRPEAIAAQVSELAKSRAHFRDLFDAGAYGAAAARGERRLSYRAMQAALLITLYGEEPLLATPARLLRGLVELDEQLAAWRHAHALMVQRMIGSKPGTGGSSGHAYLRATVERHKVFTDLLALPTYLIPRALLPALPADVAHSLAFWIEGAGAAAGADAGARALGAGGASGGGGAAPAATASGGGGGAVEAPASAGAVCPMGYGKR